jgi:excisionase family DNA binding protein
VPAIAKEVVIMTTQHRLRGPWALPDAQRQGAFGADEVVTVPAEMVFLTVQEVADLLRVSPGTVRAWAAKGEGPPSIRFGKQIRYRPEKVEEWVQEQELSRRAR